MYVGSWVVAESGDWELWANTFGHYQLRRLDDGEYRGGETLYFQSEDDTATIEAELESASDTGVWLDLWAREYAHCFES